MVGAPVNKRDGRDLGAPVHSELDPGSARHGLKHILTNGVGPFARTPHATNRSLAAAEVILFNGHSGTKYCSTIACRLGLHSVEPTSHRQRKFLTLFSGPKAYEAALYKITLRNSPNFHVAVNDTDGFTAWGVKIMTPKTARNTDGIDPGSSHNVTIAHCSIHTGDDDVAVKSGKSGPASNISILHNHFYTGHGMSIGSGTSGGVDHMLVDDLTIDGADNGIRIKSDRSRGGLVDDLRHRDVCIRDTKNPLVFTPLYTTFLGDQLPIYRDITLENIHILTAGSYTFLGLDTEYKLGLTVDNVFADDQEHSTWLTKNGGACKSSCWPG